MKFQLPWREYIQSLTTDATFLPPATLGEIEKVEASLGVLFPEKLKSLLKESDGIEGPFGLGLIWSIERIRKDNLNFRKFLNYEEIYMPFDHLLFFADAGNGDQFAFGILNGKIRKPDIYVWNHEDDSRSWIAPSLEIYFDWWMNGKLKV